MVKDQMLIEDPLVIVFRAPSGEVVTRIHRPSNFDHTHYGILVCDLVRHIARAMKVDEETIWEIVDKERASPTSEVRPAS